MKRVITITIEQVRRIVVRQSRSPTSWSDTDPAEAPHQGDPMPFIDVPSPKPALPAAGAENNDSNKKGEAS